MSNKNYKIQELKGHQKSVFAISWSPSGCLGSCSSDSTLKIWDINVKYFFN